MTRKLNTWEEVLEAHNRSGNVVAVGKGKDRPVAAMITIDGKPNLYRWKDQSDAVEVAEFWFDGWDWYEIMVKEEPSPMKGEMPSEKLSAAMTELKARFPNMGITLFVYDEGEAGVLNYASTSTRETIVLALMEFIDHSVRGTITPSMGGN